MLFVLFGCCCFCFKDTVMSLIIFGFVCFIVFALCVFCLCVAVVFLLLCLCVVEQSTNMYSCFMYLCVYLVIYVCLVVDCCFLFMLLIVFI